MPTDAGAFHNECAPPTNGIQLAGFVESWFPKVIGWACLQVRGVPPSSIQLRVRARNTGGVVATGSPTSTRPDVVKTMPACRGSRLQMFAIDWPRMDFSHFARLPDAREFRVDVYYARVPSSRLPGVCRVFGPIDFFRQGGQEAPRARTPLGNVAAEIKARKPPPIVCRMKNRPSGADFANVSLSPPTHAALAAQTPPPPRPLATPPKRSQEGFLTFRVCGGLTNQRLALLDGLMIASLLNFTAVVPSLNANGLQSGASYAELGAQTASFGTFFDFAATARALRGVVRLAPALPTGVAPIRAFKDGGAHTPVHYAELVASGARHLALNRCAFGALDKQHTPELEALLWRIDAALVFAPSIAAAAERVVAGLRRASRRRGGGGLFTALHLRIESDWVEHCARWEDGVTRTNCMTNTDQLHRTFALEGVRHDHPIYVMVDRSATANATAALGALRGLSELAATHELVDKTAYLGADAKGAAREWLAAVDYAVAQMSTRFIGNSVSTFSALLLLQRQEVGVTEEVESNRADDFHYNGGGVPLAEVMFGRPARRRRLKVVFTIGARSSAQYKEMAMVAVDTALRRTSLLPVAVLSGKRGELHRWLVRRGVRVVEHAPAWKGRIQRAADSARQRHNDAKSPLFGRAASMLATHMRLDLPILGFADEYILYADVDVMFVRDLTLAAFAPLPAYFAVATESNVEDYRRIDEGRCDVSCSSGVVGDFGGGGGGDGKAEPLAELAKSRPRYAAWRARKKEAQARQMVAQKLAAGMAGCAEVAYGNAGVMLMNVDAMRRTHAGFIAYAFSDAQIAVGLNHGIYGPQDQGAYNGHYQGRFDVHLYARWNWKPYWGHNRAAALVHFHGPKPDDYTAHRAGRNASHAIFESFVAECDRADNASLARGEGRGCSQYLDDYREALTRVQAEHPHRQ